MQFIQSHSCHVSQGSSMRWMQTCLKSWPRCLRRSKKDQRRWFSVEIWWHVYELGQRFRLIQEGPRWLWTTRSTTGKQKRRPETFETRHVELICLIGHLDESSIRNINGLQCWASKPDLLVPRSSGVKKKLEDMQLIGIRGHSSVGSWAFLQPDFRAAKKNGLNLWCFIRQVYSLIFVWWKAWWCRKISPEIMHRISSERPA